MENSKFELLSKRDYKVERLFDDWGFMSLVNFIDDIESEGIIDYDGCGEFIYADKQGTLYLKEGESIYPSMILEILNDHSTEKNMRFMTCYDAAAIIREKFTEGDYKPFAVFWYNR